MAKVKAEHQLKHKGMKAPKPDSAQLGDVKAAPKHKPKMNYKEPAFKLQSDAQSMAPDHKKKSMPHDCAPEGVSSVNGGNSYPMEKDHSLKK